MTPHTDNGIIDARSQHSVEQTVESFGSRAYTRPAWSPWQSWRMAFARCCRRCDEAIPKPAVYKLLGASFTKRGVTLILIGGNGCSRSEETKNYTSRAPTVGEIAYQLLNQTMVYLDVVDAGVPHEGGRYFADQMATAH